MKLYRSRIPKIASEIISALMKEGHIDVEDSKIVEVELDVRAIFEEFLRMEKRVIEEVKDIMEMEKISREDFAIVKRRVCEDMDHPTGERALTWLSNQIIRCFLYSPNVEEVYSEDRDLIKRVKDIIKSNMMEDDDVDREVRSRLKHLKEGTSEWDIEYSRVLKLVKQKRGLIE